MSNCVERRRLCSYLVGQPRLMQVRPVRPSILFEMGVHWRPSLRESNLYSGMQTACACRSILITFAKLRNARWNSLVYDTAATQGTWSHPSPTRYGQTDSHIHAATPQQGHSLLLPKMSIAHRLSIYTWRAARRYKSFETTRAMCRFVYTYRVWTHILHWVFQLYICRVRRMPTE